MKRAALILGLLAVHVGLGLLVHRGPALGVDRTAFDVVDQGRTRAGVDVVRVLTDLGSLKMAALVVAACALTAQRAGRTHEAIGLVVGMALLVALVSLTKELWDRPRPLNRLAEISSRSYPSGHTAYAVAWLAALSTTRKRGLVALGVLVTVFVGTSRLYLHVHYLTDVLGGAALAGAVFVACVTLRRPRCQTPPSPT